MAAFVVNPGGAVHSVEDHRAEALYAEGFRPATAEEIAAWYAMQGLDVPASLTGKAGQAGPAGVTDATSEHGGADQSGAGAGGRRRRR